MTQMVKRVVFMYINHSAHMANELELTPQLETSDEDAIEYGSPRYWDELYIPDGWLPREAEIEASEKALAKYLSTQDADTADMIDRYIEHSRVPKMERYVDTIRSAMLRLMDTMQDSNGRAEGLLLAKELEKISLEEHRLRRKAYDALHPKA